MNYLEYYGLQSEPFLNSPSSRVFHKSAAHGKALLRLMTAAEGSGGVKVLVGESGVGKSLLLRRTIESVSEEATRVALVPVPAGGMGPQALASLVAAQLRAGAAGSLDELDGLVAATVAEGVGVLILVDDAGRLSSETLSALAAIEQANVIFAGLPVGKYPDGERVELPPLNAEAVDAFVRLRLKSVGRTQEVFTSGARSKVAAVTRGIPARINAVCEYALWMGALGAQEKIDEAMIVLAGQACGVCDAKGRATEAPVSTVVAPAAPAKAAPAAKPAPAAKAAPAASAEPDGGLDDVLSQLEEEETQSGGELDSLLDDLSAQDEPAAKGNEFDDMLGGLESDDEPAPAPKAKAPPPKIESKAAVKPAPAKPAPKPAPADDDDLDSMLNDLTGGDSDDAGSDDDDLSSLLDDLGGDEPPAAKALAKPAAAAKPAAKPALAKSTPPLASNLDDDLDDLLGGLDDDAPKMAADSDNELDDLSDFLGGLDDEPEPPKAPAKAASVKAAPAKTASSDDDLDDLLSGLDDEPAPAKPAAAAKMPAAKPVAAKKQVAKPVSVPAADDDLEDLLAGLGDEPEADEPAPKSKQKGDSLENELDNLLEGLDD